VNRQITSEKIDDQSLIRSYLEGRNPGYSTFEKWVDSVIFFKGWGPRIDSADVKQETLTVLLQNLRAKRYEGGGLKSYIQSICKNLCLLALRKSYGSPTVPLDNAETLTSKNNPEDDLLKKEELRLFSDVFGRLSSICRKLLILRFKSVLGYAEIGKELQISEGAARVRLFRCLENARKIRVRIEKP